MDQKQVCASVMRCLNRLRLTEAFCDITLLVGDVPIPAHKAVLAGTSKFFHSVLSTDQATDMFQINGMSAPDMVKVLDFLYTGQILVNKNNVAAIETMAEQLQIDILSELCSTFRTQQQKKAPPPKQAAGTKGACRTRTYTRWGRQHTLHPGDSSGDEDSDNDEVSLLGEEQDRGSGYSIHTALTAAADCDTVQTEHILLESIRRSNIQSPKRKSTPKTKPRNKSSKRQRTSTIGAHKLNTMLPAGIQHCKTSLGAENLNIGTRDSQSKVNHGLEAQNELYPPSTLTPEDVETHMDSAQCVTAQSGDVDETGESSNPIDTIMQEVCKVVDLAGVSVYHQHDLTVTSISDAPAGHVLISDTGVEADLGSLLDIQNLLSSYSTSGQPIILTTCDEEPVAATNDAEQTQCCVDLVAEMDQTADDEPLGVVSEQGLCQDLMMAALPVILTTCDVNGEEPVATRNSTEQTLCCVDLVTEVDQIAGGKPSVLSAEGLCQDLMMAALPVILKTCEVNGEEPVAATNDAEQTQCCVDLVTEVDQTAGGKPSVVSAEGLCKDLMMAALPVILKTCEVNGEEPVAATNDAEQTQCCVDLVAEVDQIADDKPSGVVSEQGLCQDLMMADQPVILTTSDGAAARSSTEQTPVDEVSHHRTCPTVDAASPGADEEGADLLMSSPTPVHASQCGSVTPVHASQCGSVTPVHMSQCGSVTPVHGSPCGSVTPVQASPCGSVTPVHASPCGSVTPVHTSPCGSVTPVHASPCGSVTPVHTSPCGSVTPVHASPCSSVTPVHTSPCGSVTPVHTSPCGSVTPVSSVGEAIDNQRSFDMNTNPAESEPGFHDYCLSTDTVKKSCASESARQLSAKVDLTVETENEEADGECQVSSSITVLENNDTSLGEMEDEDVPLLLVEPCAEHSTSMVPASASSAKEVVATDRSQTNITLEETAKTIAGDRIGDRTLVGSQSPGVNEMSGSPWNDMHIIIIQEPNQESEITNKNQRLSETTEDSSHLPCPWCSATFTNSVQLRTHTKDLHPDSMYTCSFCRRTFVQEERRDTHMDWCRVGEKVHGRYRCPQCTYSAAKALYVVNHYRVKHTTRCQRTCDHCHQVFNTLDNYYDHQLQVHQEDITHVFRRKVYACSECGFRTVKAHLLKSHTTGHSEKRVSCKLCDKSFKTAMILKRHEKFIHSGDLLRCSQCAFGSKYAATLKAHEYRAHDIKSAKQSVHHCHYCDYSHVDRSNLSKHERFKHSDERPFLCSFCPTSFKHKHQMTVHERTHTGLRPFQCPLCPYAGGSKLALRTHHRYRHSDTKPFGCDMCGFHTKAASNLLAHKARCRKRLTASLKSSQQKKFSIALKTQTLTSS